MNTYVGGMKAGKGRSSPLEVGLLAVGLAALALGAGAVGWTLGLGSRVDSAGAAAPKVAAATPAGSTVNGDRVAGKAVFNDSGCASCHAFAAAGARGTGGPNLDQVNLSASEVLDWVTNGKGAMPSFKGQVSAKKLSDVAAFLAK